MRKLMLIMSLMAAMTAGAQTDPGSLTLKPLVGLTIANVTDNDGGTSKLGFAAGAELEYMMSDKFSLTGGAIYSMQGTKADGVDLKVNMEYINIPILANYYVAPGFAIKAGIQPGFKTKAEVKLEGVTVDMDKYYDGVNSIDFSIPVGLSYEYSGFVLDARYNWGLTKVLKDADSKNSVFMISLGYKFSL